MLGVGDKPRGCSEPIPGAKQDLLKCSCEREKEEAAGRGQGGGVQSKFWGLRSVARPGLSSDTGGTLPKQHKIPQSAVSSQGCQDCQGVAAMDSLLWWELCSECRAWVTELWNHSH